MRTQMYQNVPKMTQNVLLNFEKLKKPKKIHRNQGEPTKPTDTHENPNVPK